MAQVEKINAGQYKITGDLDFSTVTALLTQLHTLLGSDLEMTVDLSSLGRSNSAGLALLMELKGDAKRLNRKITFVGIPQLLLDLASMSNVAEILEG